MARGRGFPHRAVIFAAVVRSLFTTSLTVIRGSVTVMGYLPREFTALSSYHISSILGKKNKTRKISIT
jgi:hypothetical protein